MANTTHTPPEALTQRDPPWNIVGAIIAFMSVFTLTSGLTYPLLALILEKQGVSETLIGFNAAMTPLGLMICSPLIPILARRYGAWWISLISLIITGSMFILLGAFQNVYLWFPMRLILGFSVGGLFIISETWLNQMATPQTRGRVMSLYTTIVSVGFGLGPFIVGLLGTEGWLPFLVGVGAALLAIGVQLAIRGRVPEFEADEQEGSIRKFFPQAIAISLAVAAFSFLEGILFSFLPIYGLRNGLTETVITTALTVQIMGAATSQFPIGWLADRWEARTLLIICVAATLIGSIALPFIITSIWLWPVFFIWGGLSFGVYTTALTELGNRFSGTMLLAGNATFSLMWGLGGIVGPPITGSVISFIGIEGLPLTLIVTFALFTVFISTRRSSATDQSVASAP